MDFDVAYTARVLHAPFFYMLYKFIKFFLSPSQSEGKQGSNLRFILRPWLFLI